MSDQRQKLTYVCVNACSCANMELIGPSGVGKTHLVGLALRSLNGWELLDVTPRKQRNSKSRISELAMEASSVRAKLLASTKKIYLVIADSAVTTAP